MKATEIAAWWGAIIATLVLAWDMYKWKRSGPIINVSASPNMQTFGGVSNGLENKTFVVVEITNTGGRKTTLTKLVGFHCKSIFQKLRRKEDESFIVDNPAPSQPLPHVLGPGERWLGSIEQNEELEEMSRSGYLFCGVYHSSGKKPVLQPVVINKSDAT
jgi:hypothetical protein